MKANGICKIAKNACGKYMDFKLMYSFLLLLLTDWL